MPPARSRKRGASALLAVLDANVWFSMALQQRGTGPALMQHYMDGSFVPVASDRLLAEIRSMLSLARVRQKYGFSRADADALVDYLASRSCLVALAGDVAMCRDPADDHLIEACVRAQAGLIVSSDPDLHDARLVARLRALGIVVLRPAEFLQKLRDRV